MQLFVKILSGMANTIQTLIRVLVWSGSTPFAYVILSETFAYYFRTFTIIRKSLGTILGHLP